MVEGSDFESFLEIQPARAALAATPEIREAERRGIARR